MITMKSILKNSIKKMIVRLSVMIGAIIFGSSMIINLKQFNSVLKLNLSSELIQYIVICMTLPLALIVDIYFSKTIDKNENTISV